MQNILNGIFEAMLQSGMNEHLGITDKEIKINFRYVKIYVVTYE